MSKHVAPARSSGRAALNILWKATKIALLLVLLGLIGLIFMIVATSMKMTKDKSFACVLEGTLVDTPSGPVAVEQLRIGDAVWTRSPDGDVRRGFVVAMRRGRAVRYRSLLVTGSHPIATAPGVFATAGTLEAGAEVESRAGRLRLTSVEAGYGLANVYDISVEPGQTFFAGGVLVHNKSIAPPESGTIGDIRSLVSAQSAYQSANQGYYDGRLECLTSPWVCLPGYPEDGLIFLGEELTALKPRYNYEREFIPSEPVGALLEGISPSSVEGFVYLAVPLADAEGLERAFCGDHTGLICFTPNGERPLVEDGHCVVEGRDVSAAPEPGFYERGFGETPNSRPCRVIQ